MRRLITLGISGLVATALLAGPAYAWHITNPTATRDCGSVVVTVIVPDEDWFTGSATLTVQSETATTDEPGNLAVSIPLDDAAPAGSFSGAVTWSDSPSETEHFTVDYPAAPEGCKPPTTEPPTDDTEEPQGSSTGTKRKHYPPTPTLKTDSPPELGIPPKDAKVPERWRESFTG